jgi:tetratricopeptide (TPR) repeat protein
MCGLQTTQGKFDGVEPRLNESLHHFRRLGKVRGVDRGLYFLARYLFTTGQFHQVIEPLKECMDINLRTNNDYHYHRALIWLGAARAHLGQYDLAKEELAKGDSYFYNHQNANSSSILGALCLGELALVDNLPLQVQEYLVHNLKKRESSNLMPMCFLVSALQAGAAALSGDLEQSRKSLACGLNGAPHYYDYLVYSKMLQFLILYFLRHKDLELAVEFDALARCIPLLANSTIYPDLVGQSLAAQMPGLPVDIISAAQQRGSLRDLQSTIQELSASPLFHYEKSIGE